MIVTLSDMIRMAEALSERLPGERGQWGGVKARMRSDLVELLVYCEPSVRDQLPATFEFEGTTAMVHGIDPVTLYRD